MINKVTLIGNIGTDPEGKDLPSGIRVVNFSMATTEKWKDKNTGDNVEKTEWHKIVAFSRLAEIIEQYCRKGSKIYIEGRIQTRDWETDQGEKRYMTEIVAKEMKMLGGKTEKPEASPKSAHADDDFNDDIPF